MKKKTIGFLVCTLLISVAVIPGINALDNEVDYVNEPKFSLQDTDAWEGIINDLVARFESAETQESKIAILEEIPVVMDIFGLLPEDLTVEEAQELIVSSYMETLSSDSFQSDQQSNVAGDSLLMNSKNVIHSSLPQLQVSESNRINSIKLNPPQPAPWPPQDKCIIFGFGRISNPKHEFNGDEYYWSFNCINVRCVLVDEYGRWYPDHFTDGEELYTMGPPLLIKIITDHFLFVL